MKKKINLSLKKTTISRLNDDQKRTILGGSGDCEVGHTDQTLDWACLDKSDALCGD